MITGSISARKLVGPVAVSGKKWECFTEGDMHVSENTIGSKNKSAEYRAEDVVKYCNLCKHERKAAFL